MQIIKTTILATSVIALAGCASWDKSPICEPSHGWVAWSDTRCNPPEAPKDIAAELAAAQKQNSALSSRVSDLERQLAEAKTSGADRDKLAADLDLNNERLLINLAAGYLFGSGEDQLKPAGADALKDVGTILKAYPEYQVTVNGHTDNHPIRGALREKFPTNMELSEARAANAATALGEGGLSAVTTHGFADTKPMAPNTTAAGRAKNRRVEVRVTM